MEAPRHIAIIMDGNGRWAIKRGEPRLKGHRAGVETLDRVMHYARAAGVKYLSVYAFSTENWRRPKVEVDGLMKLLGWYIRRKKKQLLKDNVRFRVMGRKSDLPESVQKLIADLEEATRNGEWELIVCLSYGGRAEIVDAAERYAAKLAQMRTANAGAEPGGDAGSKAGEGGNAGAGAGEGAGLGAKEREELFASCLYLPDVPDPDLIIRTSGELRVSNFLLWECAYSEFYITDVLWPDFSEADFNAALESYSHRERRLGSHK